MKIIKIITICSIAISLKAMEAPLEKSAKTQEFCKIASQKALPLTLLVAHHYAHTLAEQLLPEKVSPSLHLSRLPSLSNLSEQPEQAIKEAFNHLAKYCPQEICQKIELMFSLYILLSTEAPEKKKSCLESMLPLLPLSDAQFLAYIKDIILPYQNISSPFSPIHISNDITCTLMHLATAHASPELLLYLVSCNASHASVNCTDSLGSTPAHYAASREIPAILETLIDFGAEVNLCNHGNLHPLEYAYFCNHSPNVEALTQIPALYKDQNKALLHTLSSLVFSNNPAIPILIREKLKKYKLYKELPLLAKFYFALATGKRNYFKHYSSLFDHEMKQDTILSNLFDKWQSLHVAVNFNNDKAAEWLIKQGASVNARTAHLVTPLHLAITTGSETLVKLLLENGASPDIPGLGNCTPVHHTTFNNQLPLLKLLLPHTKNIDAQTSEGHTALHLAIINNCEDIAELLLKQGASAQQANPQDGYTALHRAVNSGNSTLVKMLMKCNANIEAATNYGCTPLHLAALAGNPHIITLLLEHGANIEAQDIIDQTPLYYAVTDMNLPCLELLVQAAHEHHLDSAATTFAETIIGMSEDDFSAREALLKALLKYVTSTRKDELLQLAIQENHLPAISLLEEAVPDTL